MPAVFPQLASFAMFIPSYRKTIVVAQFLSGLTLFAMIELWRTMTAAGSYTAPVPTPGAG